MLSRSEVTNSLHLYWIFKVLKRANMSLLTWNFPQVKANIYMFQLKFSVPLLPTVIGVKLLQSLYC